MQPQKATINMTTFSRMPVPAKALATCAIVAMSLGMAGALGQIVIHDIIPTFFMSGMHAEKESASAMQTTSHVNQKDVHAQNTQQRGDLFTDITIQPSAPERPPIHKNEQFVWTLRWSHIHLFGMSMIFLFMGGVTLFLDMGSRLKTGLIILPFAGVWIDIAAMWLKGFVSPAFFWLHIPGGGIFVSIFVYVSIKALGQMWFSKPSIRTQPVDFI